MKKLGEQEATLKNLESRLRLQEARIRSLELSGKSQEGRLKMKQSEIQKLRAQVMSQEGDLAEEVTCMVCLDLPGPGKVPVCVNGHIICQICIRLVPLFKRT